MLGVVHPNAARHATRVIHDPPRCFALVPCAGSGSRAGSEQPKQYIPIAGAPMVDWTLRALGRVPRVRATLVVLAAADPHFESALPWFGRAQGQWVARCGGDTRAATVANGLRELAQRGAGETDWVLVHDAARCLIEPGWVDRLIDACANDPVGGLLAMPLADTLKDERGGRSIQTIDRAHKWLAQTPQMFRAGMLAQALRQAGDGVTDEAGAVEASGHAPKLVPGDARNFKLTWPADFALAALLLRSRQAPAALNGVDAADAVNAKRHSTS